MAEATEAYAAWLSAETGSYVARPPRREREYAATGGQDREFPWGDEWDPARANTAERGTTRRWASHHAGPSPFGLYDVAGTSRSTSATATPPIPAARPSTTTRPRLTAESTGSPVAVMPATADLARCRRRHGWYPSDHYAMGFRLAEAI